MKPIQKTLLAAALLTGFASAANAQSSITLYGIADAGIEYLSVTPGDNYAALNPADAARNGTAARSRFGMGSGQQTGSHWGLRGVERINPGTSVNFVYEAGVNLTDGSMSGFSRQSTIGMSTRYGSFDLGRKLSAGSYAFRGIDPFAAGFGIASLNSSMGTHYLRYSNMLAYTTPTWNGFSGAIGYSFDTGLDGYRLSNARGTVSALPSPSSSFETNNKQRALTLGLRYENGPLVLAATYDQVHAPQDINPGARRVSAWSLGGTYDFQRVKLHAAYGQQINGIINGSEALSEAGVTGGATNAPGGVLFASAARVQSWMIGASTPISPTTDVFTSVQQMIPGGNFTSHAHTATQTVTSVGATYNLSKHTNLYGYYAYSNNYAMVDGAKASVVGVGLRHIF